MAITELPEVITPNSTFLREVEKKSKEKVSACYQCEKCTNGCPVSFAMDIVPHKVIRLINLGLRNEILNSDTIWVCASCETCTSRCPNDIDIAHIMDSLRQIAQSSGIKASQENVPLFHDAFMDCIKSQGRVWEPAMVLRYKLKSKAFTQDMKLAVDMVKKGSLKFRPSRFRAGDEVKKIFKESKGRG